MAQNWIYWAGKKDFRSQGSFSANESDAIDQEMLKGIIDLEITCYGPEETISTIFIRPKKDGCFRGILNLKRLNQLVTHHHFKMEKLRSITKLIKKDCFLT